MAATRKRELARADRVQPGVWRLRLPLPWLGVPHVNAYAIAAGSGVVLFDTGMHEPGSFAQLERALEQAGLGVEHIRLVVCTHAHSDHYGQAASICAAAGCELWMHPAHGHMTEPVADPEAELERRIEVARQSGMPLAALQRLALLRLRLHPRPGRRVPRQPREDPRPRRRPDPRRPRPPRPRPRRPHRRPPRPRRRRSRPHPRRLRQGPPHRLRPRRPRDRPRIRPRHGHRLGHVARQLLPPPLGGHRPGRARRQLRPGALEIDLLDRRRGAPLSVLEDWVRAGGFEGRCGTCPTLLRLAVRLGRAASGVSGGRTGSPHHGRWSSGGFRAALWD